MDVIDRCQNKSSFLRNKLNEVAKTSETIHETLETVRQSLTRDAERLRESITSAIHERCEQLIKAAEETADKDLRNANSLHQQYEADLKRVDQISQEAQLSVELGRECVQTNSNMLQKLREIGKRLEEPPFVSMSFSSKLDDSAMVTAIGQSKSALRLSMTGSVQITDCIERPGAIEVLWDEQDSDCESATTDTSSGAEYILQCSGKEPEEVGGEPVFNTVYEGEEMSFLMTFAEPNQTYTFRVCQYHLQGAGGGVCGAWSLPKQAFTSIPPHSWRSEDCSTGNGMALYQLSNSNRTATKVFPECSRVLRSRDASYRLGQHLTFRIDESSDSMANDGVGLMVNDQQDGKQLSHWSSAAIINSKGTIFVNGQAMVTKLPALKRDSLVVFHAREHTAEKLRVSVSIDDKEVTFDWTTALPNHGQTLFFACAFEQTGWQVSVS